MQGDYQAAVFEYIRLIPQGVVCTPEAVITYTRRSV